MLHAGEGLGQLPQGGIATRRKVWPQKGAKGAKESSFPNSIWERTCPGNSIAGTGRANTTKRPPPTAAMELRPAIALSPAGSASASRMRSCYAAGQSQMEFGNEEWPSFFALFALFCSWIFSAFRFAWGCCSFVSCAFVRLFVPFAPALLSLLLAPNRVC